MCGVIGYTGSRDTAARLLSGLERLEYRGYDSAGICLWTADGLEFTKAVGKLENLKRKADGRTSRSTTGIGHTRWATHGRVTEQNAHPLRAGDHTDVAIVLNGIVENHGEIRRELAANGETFASQTDAEVVAHLVRRAYRGSLAEAVRTAYTRLEGHFAFVAVHANQPGLLVGARNRCPLLVGVGVGEMFLASSISAFADDTRRVMLVEDDEIVAITATSVRLVGADGEPREREEILIPWDDATAERGGYETYMLKEIHEQPQAVGETLARNLLPDASSRAPGLALASVGDRNLAGFRRIVIVACGTAYHAGLVGRLAIEEWANLPCDVEVASEWRYRRPHVDDDTLVVGISQSGETADTLGALRLARGLGARTLAITNSPGSQVTREVDAVLYTHAGLEMGVAATKTFTTQLALLYLLALRIGELRGAVGDGRRTVLTDELRALPQKLAACLEGSPSVEAVAERHQDKPFFFYLGRHTGLPVCLEGALKLKEIAYIPTEAYAAGEMKHGPIALLDDQTPVVCVATASHVADKLQSNLQEVRARGPEVIAIATAGDPDIADVADEVIEVPRTDPLLQPMLAVVPLQLLAYHIAVGRGEDVDQPRNLAKTVTVE
jgi:glucosamine--fructose-6-phosphate aminotransferase (isomerizing)